MDEKELCYCDKGEGLEIGTEAWAEMMENPATCLLEKGHAGEHVYTPDEVE